MILRYRATHSKEDTGLPKSFRDLHKEAEQDNLTKNINIEGLCCLKGAPYARQPISHPCSSATAGLGPVLGGRGSPRASPITASESPTDLKCQPALRCSTFQQHSRLDTRVKGREHAYELCKLIITMETQVYELIFCEVQ